jgi:hypothetical protein
MKTRHGWYLAAAGAIAAVTIAAFLLIDPPRRTQSVMAASVEALHRTDGHAPEIAGEVAILRTLGSSVDAIIQLPAAGEALELRVLPEFTARPERYRISLFRMTADDSLQRVAELGGLAPAFDNFVTVFVDGTRLQPGRYRLAIAGDPDTDARDKESAFILKLRREPTDPSAKSR